MTAPEQGYMSEVTVVLPGGRIVERICESEGARRARIAALKDDAAMLSALLNEMCVHSGTMDTARKLARSVRMRVEEME